MRKLWKWAEASVIYCSQHDGKNSPVSPAGVIDNFTPYQWWRLWRRELDCGVTACLIEWVRLEGSEKQVLYIAHGMTEKNSFRAVVKSSSRRRWRQLMIFERKLLRKAFRMPRNAIDWNRSMLSISFWYINTGKASRKNRSPRIMWLSRTEVSFVW